MPYNRRCFDINHLKRKSCNHCVRGDARKCIRVQGSDRWLQAQHQIIQCGGLPRIDASKMHALIDQWMHIGRVPARLCQSRVRPQRAIEVLAPIFRRFSEGHEGPDLRDAEELLAVLNRDLKVSNSTPTQQLRSCRSKEISSPASTIRAARRASVSSIRASSPSTSSSSGSRR